MSLWLVRYFSQNRMSLPRENAPINFYAKIIPLILRSHIMHIIIAGGTGFIGQALVQHYLKANHQITIIGRTTGKIEKIFGNTVKVLTWNQLETSGIPAIKDADLIINLAGANIGAQKWTQKRKQEILNSRIIPTQTLANLCAKLGKTSPALFNASAIGVYGLQETLEDKLPPPINEKYVIDFFQAPDFLAEVGRAWEQATEVAKQAGVRVVNMRFGVVLDKSGGVLAQLKIPFLFGLGGPIAGGAQPFSWISLSDLINAIDFVFNHPEINGPVNFVAPVCASQKQFAQALGKALHRPSFIPTSGLMLKLAFGQMADELLLRGQHVVPDVLTHLGFKFQHVDIQSALNSIFSKQI